MAMPSDQPPAAEKGQGRARFATTRWSLVMAAGQRDRPGADRALAELFEAYWYPLYAEARRRGLTAEEASDRVQGFFARLLEKGDLAAANRAKGRFRTFLLTAFGHFNSNEWDRARTRKRGGGRTIVSLDQSTGESRFGAEPSHNETPERIFDRRWAHSLLERALRRLQEEWNGTGKAVLFEALKPALAGDRGTSYAELAQSLGMTEGAIKTAVCRLRARCAMYIRDEVSKTVAGPGEIDEELGLLFSALES
jgi:RNA polymerase sigma factor (sigma-70 family)